MADEGLRPIIVKRIKKGGGGHHGGAWKIAYADFVTAMMAFFLLMWLLGSTAKGDLNGIAEYFKTPLKVAMAGGSGSGDANTVLPGGGKDLTRQEGQLRKGENEVVNKRSVRAAQAELEKAERQRLDELKKRIETAIDSSPTLKQFKNQLLIDITSEGLRIQIVDEKNRPMFALASAQLQPYTREILREIGKTLNDVPNKISLSGHTDATPFSGGMDESKVLRVVGLSSAVLLDKEDPFNPINRRISIIVMNKKAEELVENNGSTMDVTSDSEVKEGLSAPAKN